MTEEKILFQEKQYLGYNKYSIIRRMVLMLFCFAAYWWTTHRGQNGNIFFLLGVAILFISLVSLFVLHLKTTVYMHCIVLDGLWTTRKVKIDLDNIVQVEGMRYSKYHLNNPVYNLHLKGKVRFYTGGREAVEITDKDGLKYRIGTQRRNDLENILKDLTAQNTAAQRLVKESLASKN
jgi:hypothetical protein